MVETDRAVAFVMDDILLASLVAGSKTPAAYKISDDAFSLPEPYGIMLRKDDAEFKKVVDSATAALYKSPEGTAIYNKWFTQADPAQGPQSERADERADEEAVRQSERFARSGGLLGPSTGTQPTCDRRKPARPLAARLECCA